MIALILAALLVEPVPAARIAAQAFDVPEADLVAIVRRESAGQRVGVHEGDAWASRLVCRKARRVGWLAEDVDCTSGGWSTRGCSGIMVGYGLRYIGMSRWPWLFDVPLISTIAAARRWRDVCRTRPDGWCPSARGDV